MPRFRIHEEAPFPTERVFLEWWLPLAAVELERLLHRHDPAEIHVVLSEQADHRRRFPPDPSELRILQADGRHSDGEDPGASPMPMPALDPGVYKHGVTTLSRTELALPANVAAGATVICLDITTIRKLAKACRVSVETMLGRTAIHELSHALRGHMLLGSGDTHGYLAEGDAQRDTWQVLADLMVASVACR